MIVGRRGFLGAGIGATLWTFLRPAGAETPPPRLDPDGFRLIEAAPVNARLSADPTTPIRALGYEGATPGPLLRLRKGEELKARLVNGLGEPTTLCWRGLRLENSMAGIGDLTQPPVPPGGRFDYRFTPREPGFGWYGPHVGARTAGQIARGLYGPVIVEEAAPPVVDLEAVVALRDWALDPQGQVDPAAAGQVGALICANGGPAPLALGVAPGGRVRLRLLNAACARIMIIGIEGVKPTIAAVDGQPSETFEPLRNAFPMGPGARFELFFDMPRDPGATVRFVLRGGEASPIASEPDRPLVVFTTSSDPAPARPPFAGLAANPLLPAEIDLARAKRADVAITGGEGGPFSINGASLATPWPAKPLFSVARGAPVTLGIANGTKTIQAIRIAGHVARLLHPLDDGWEPYWRESVLIAPGKTSHLAFVADNPGRWPIELTIPLHQAAGVRTYFMVG